MASSLVTPSGARTEDEQRARFFAWPKLAAAFALLIGLLVTAALARAHTGGSFIYPVDDAYIHLAAARRFVETGDRTFLAASSSIAWPWLLVLLRELGAKDLAPLAVNIVVTIALFFVLERALTNFGARRSSALALLLLVLVPIVPLALSGMEHTTHALFVLALALIGARTVARCEPVRWPIFLCAFGAVAFRYEAIFVVLPILFLFFVARRSRDAVLVGGAALLPVIASGIASIARGGYFLPVPVLLKRTQLDLFSLPAKIYYRLIDNPHVLVLFVLLLFALRAERNDDASKPSVLERRGLLLIAIVTLTLQTTFAQLGWFYRYEAYAILLGLVAVAASALAHRAALRNFAIPFFVLALPLVGRGIGSFRTTILASENIFDQEVQMASFVRAHYDDRAVALNDIGAVAYFSNAHVVDLMGLASPRIARARGMRIDGPLDEKEIAAITQDEQAPIAILYEDWFAGSIPAPWHKIGSWKIANNHVCAKDTVTFYATSAIEGSILTENLRAFSTQLPASITQTSSDLR